jgi:DHA1 family bicyclomycin/chloramphenicol resistance-like MFS transporter
VSPRQRLVLTLVLGGLIAFPSMAIDMYLPALPTLVRELNTPAGRIQTTLSVFFVGLALGQAFYGPLADRFGRRPPLFFGIALFVLASVGSALSNSIESLIVWRFIQAAGACAAVVMARAIVRDLFNERDSARMYAMLMLVMGVAPILAPLVGGQLLTLFGWRAIFWTLAAFGITAFIVVILALRETWPPERRVSGGLGGVLAIYWLLLSDRIFLAYVLTSGFAQAGMFAYIAGSPFVFIDLYGVPAEHYGLIFGSNAAGLILASQINHRLLRKTTGHRILRVSVMGNAVAGVILALVALSGTASLPLLLAPLFLCVASIGFIAPNAVAAAMARHGDNAGSAAALIGMLQYSGGAIVAGVMAAVNDDSARPLAFVIAGCAFCALLLQTVALPHTAPHR